MTRVLIDVKPEIVTKNVLKQSSYENNEIKEIQAVPIDDYKDDIIKEET